MRKKVVETRMPRIINTALKPRAKPAAAQTRRGWKDEVSCVFVDTSRSLPRPIPPRMHKYEGISGNTHGDKKESRPAAKTKSSEISCDIL